MITQQEELIGSLESQEGEQFEVKFVLSETMNKLDECVNEWVELVREVQLNTCGMRKPIHIASTPNINR